MRLLADENFNNRVLRGLVRRLPGLNVVRVQDTDRLGARDEAVLDFAAEENRVILTHDLATMVPDAGRRLARGRTIPGLVAVNDALPVGAVIDDLELLFGASTPSELENQIYFLPL